MARSKSIGSMYVALGLNDKKFKDGMNNASKKLAEFSKTSAKYIAAGAAVAGTAIAATMTKAVSAASDLQESVSKSEAVFGASAQDVQAWAKTSANAFGQSNQQALEAAATIGNMMKAMGMADAESAKMSKTIVELASDLASFNNTSIDEAITAINAALRGESEPIRRYGVLLDDATLKAEAFAKGIFDGKGSLDPATRALAAYDVILRQTKTAQGDFARTSDGLANSSRTLQAQIANATAGLGQGLLPAIQAITSALKGVDTQGFGEKLGGMIGDFAAEWVSIFSDGTTWELLVLNFELALAKMMQSPGLKQINMMLDRLTGNTGPFNAENGGTVSLLEQQIEAVYDRIAKQAEEDAVKKDKARRESESPTAPTAPTAPVVPIVAPEPAKAPDPIERMQIDDYTRRGLAMSANPGDTQNKILKVQEAIRDILKAAKIQDKQLVW
jgi:hypothetical protein